MNCPICSSLKIQHIILSLDCWNINTIPIDTYKILKQFWKLTQMYNKFACILRLIVSLLLMYFPKNVFNTDSCKYLLFSTTEHENNWASRLKCIYFKNNDLSFMYNWSNLCFERNITILVYIESLERDRGLWFGCRTKTISLKP